MACKLLKCKFSQDCCIYSINSKCKFSRRFTEMSEQIIKFMLKYKGLRIVTVLTLVSFSIQDRVVLHKDQPVNQNRMRSS